MDVPDCFLQWQIYAWCIYARDCGPLHRNGQALILCPVLPWGPVPPAQAKMLESGKSLQECLNTFSTARDNLRAQYVESIS